MSSIEFRAVTKDYPGGVRAVEDLTLSVASGEWLLLVGPSGGGKTTVLRLIAGLESPTAGTLWIDGIDAATLAPHRRRVALAAQEPALYPHRTAAENLAFGARPEPGHLGEVVEALGLGPFLTAYPGRLSGGQRQRVALGRALVRRAAILLLDEPLAQVDAPARAEIRARLPLLVGSPPPTIIHVTHDQDEALDLADRVALLAGGRLEQAGAVAEMLQRPRTPLVAAFLRRRPGGDTPPADAPRRDGATRPDGPG